MYGVRQTVCEDVEGWMRDVKLHVLLSLIPQQTRLEAKLLE